MRRQRGMGFAGLIVLLIGIVFVAIIGMKLVPVYIEFYTVKKAIASLAQSGELRNATVADVRKAFDQRAVVDNITAITPADLEVTKDGNQLVIAFAYEKRVPLFYNISLLIDFAASTDTASARRRAD